MRWVGEGALVWNHYERSSKGIVQLQINLVPLQCLPDRYLNTTFRFLQIIMEIDVKNCGRVQSVHKLKCLKKNCNVWLKFNFVLYMFVKYLNITITFRYCRSSWLEQFSSFLFRHSTKQAFLSQRIYFPSIQFCVVLDDWIFTSKRIRINCIRHQLKTLNLCSVISVGPFHVKPTGRITNESVRSFVYFKYIYLHVFCISWITIKFERKTGWRHR